MRLNIPLLPLVIDLRWRPLSPFRPKISLLGLIFTVGFLGVFFSLAAQSARLHRIGSYHAEQSLLVTLIKTPNGQHPPAIWHIVQSNQYHAEAQQYDEMAGALLVALVSLGTLAAIGRVLDWVGRRGFLGRRQ